MNSHAKQNCNYVQCLACLRNNTSKFTIPLNEKETQVRVYTQKLKICNPTLPTYIRIQLSSLVNINSRSAAEKANRRHPRPLSSGKTTQLSKPRWANERPVQYWRSGGPQPLSTHERVLKLLVNFAKQKHT